MVKEWMEFLLFFPLELPADTRIVSCGLSAEREEEESSEKLLDYDDDEKRMRVKNERNDAKYTQTSLKTWTCCWENIAKTFDPDRVAFFLEAEAGAGASPSSAFLDFFFFLSASA